jgi:hypothetical protein
MKPCYPGLEDSIKRSTHEASEKFKGLFGIFGQYKYTVTMWYYLTLCNHHIKKRVVALKCLQKTLKELSGVLGSGSNDIKSKSS